MTLRVELRLADGLSFAKNCALAGGPVTVCFLAHFSKLTNAVLLRPVYVDSVRLECANSGRSRGLAYGFSSSEAPYQKQRAGHIFWPRRSCAKRIGCDHECRGMASSALRNMKRRSNLLRSPLNQHTVGDFSLAILPPNSMRHRTNAQLLRRAEGQPYSN